MTEQSDGNKISLSDGRCLIRQPDESYEQFGVRVDHERVTLRAGQRAESRRTEDALIKATRVWGEMDSPYRRGEVPPLRQL